MSPLKGKKMELLLLFFNILCAAWTIVSLSGYLLYKLKADIQNWETGVYKVLTFGFDILYTEITGQIPLEYIINTALIFNDDEVLDLVESLSHHPYDTPSLERYSPNINGISWIDIHAVGLTPPYKDIDSEQIGDIATKKINNYTMKSRKIKAQVFIKIATPKRLYLAIPLSDNGYRFLQQQQDNAIEEAQEILPLEEEIDIWSD